MIKLQGHSLTAGEIFTPEAMGLNLEERQGSATLTLGPEAPELAVDDWVLDDTEPGAGIVWRVRTVEERYQTGARSVTLEHLIATLRDHVIFGSLTPEDMGGTGGVVNARTAALRVLSYQSDWRLGSFGYASNTQPFEFTGDTVGAALETICSACEDAEWTYDFASYPFTINILPRGSEIAELRGNRNLQSARKTIDRTGMYTRIYPIGQNDLHLTETYLSRNESLYGVISKIETDQTMTTEAQLRAWAAARLKRHCEPTVTVAVSGLDLSQATGEPLDKLVIGKQCRVPMPELGTAIVERIVKLQWKDKIGQPEAVTATLANTTEDVASIMRQERNKSGGGGGAKKAKQDGEDHAWFVDTTDHVAMVAEAVAGEGAATDWSRVAQIVVDGEGIHQRVTEAQADIVAAESTITVLSNSIDLQTSRMDTVGNILQQAGLSINAQGVLVYADDNANMIGSKMEALSNSITLQVSNATTKAALILKINGTGGSSATLSADVIDINGVVTALSAYNISCGNITCGNISAQAVTAEGAVSGDAGYFSTLLDCEGTISSDGDIEAAGDLTTHGRTVNVVDASVSNGTLTITKADGTSINFSKAISSASWSWVNGHASVTLQPQSQTYTSNNIDAITKSGSPTWANDNKSFTQTLIISDEDGITVTKFDNVLFSTTQSYNAGWAAAYGKVELPTAGTGQSMSVKVPVSTVDANAATYQYTITNKNNNAVQLSDTHQVVAEFTHGKYDAGWAAAYGKVSIPGAGTSQTMSVSVPAATVDAAAATYQFTITNKDNNTVQLSRPDVVVAEFAHNKYTAGYNAGVGEFSLASVTLQGTAYTTAVYPLGGASIQVLPVAQSIYPIKSSTAIRLGSVESGASTIRLGSAQTYYLRKTSGSISVKAYGSGSTQLYYKSATTGNYISAGTCQWYMGGVSGSTTYYQSDGSVSAYAPVSTGGTLYYDKGTTGSYYPVVSTNGTLYYQADTKKTCYIQDTTSGTIYYTIGDRVTGLRNAGSTNTTTYYTRSTS